MKRFTITIFASLLIPITLSACGSEDNATCNISVDNWSAANSGGLCQVNFFGDTEYAVYCATDATGSYDCACGPAIDSPFEFVSPDFCDLPAEERACAAISICSFPL